LRAGTLARRRRIIIRESLIALAILQLFVFAGSAILRALGLQAYTLGISGGIVLFMIALGMVFPARKVLDKRRAGGPADRADRHAAHRGSRRDLGVILPAQTNPVLNVAAEWAE
jgi:small neutral amino acid transporter SnatA (MarC family)